MCCPVIGVGTCRGQSHFGSCRPRYPGPGSSRPDSRSSDNTADFLGCCPRSGETVGLAREQGLRAASRASPLQSHRKRWVARRGRTVAVGKAAQSLRTGSKIPLGAVALWQSARRACWDRSVSESYSPGDLDRSPVPGGPSSGAFRAGESQRGSCARGLVIARSGSAPSWPSFPASTPAPGRGGWGACWPIWR